ncbi:hypothetical protein LTR05_006810 [Lithohypha guttulata]|uniref:Mei2-like C-terminal RNA recognition motif domain-containing protein n=1 Tax=Lithohypha guttulata TaxID=1690604 RepID=A0AAN7YES5_9EURO|nr:hypothetical protein LTR05_006810 [Lithohypha guttulata]
MEAYNLSSSPPSGGTNTHHGTPSTIATIMSPEAGASSVQRDADVNKLDLALNRREASGSLTISKRRHVELAPVNTSIPRAPLRVLSGAAAHFTPTPTTMTPGQPLVGAAATHNVPGDPCHPGVIGCGPPPPPMQLDYRNVGKFTTELVGSTRAFVVKGIAIQDQAGYELVSETYENFKSLVDTYGIYVQNGLFAVEFYDHAEAKEAMHLTQAIWNGFFSTGQAKCSWVLPKELAAIKGLPIDGISNHVAEFTIDIVKCGPVATTNVDARTIFDMCAELGLVKAFRVLPASKLSSMRYQVEWSDARIKALKLSGKGISGFRVAISAFKPDLTPQQASGIGLSSTLAPSNARVEANYGRATSRRPLPPSHSDGRGPGFGPRMQTGARGGQQHNVVDLDRIRYGLDVRTTIMIRNIPNRVDQAAMKMMLDMTSFGRYDFMYLRIDFNNKCNVGYAFVNFAHPVDIITFAVARVGKR